MFGHFHAKEDDVDAREHRRKLLVLLRKARMLRHARVVEPDEIDLVRVKARVRATVRVKVRVRVRVRIRGRVKVRVRSEPSEGHLGVVDEVALERGELHALGVRLVGLLPPGWG